MSINRALRHGQHSMDVSHCKYAGLFWNGKRKAEIFYRGKYRFYITYLIL